MSDLLKFLESFTLSDRGEGFVKAAVLILIGLVVSRFAGAATQRVLRARLSPQAFLLARRLVSYGLFGLFFVSALREAGFDLSVLLGAAGLLTVALGFAAQTSVSNIISGIFLLGERAFELGENVTIGTVTGEVLSIDWMSVKLRTFDNLMVRLPNETVLKAQITNLSRFPIRRLDQQLGVGYESDFAQVRAVLMGVASKNPLCLDEPAPVLFHKGFGDSAVLLQFSVWFITPNAVLVKNQLPQEIFDAFRAAGIEIPFPQRTVHFRDTKASVGEVEGNGLEAASIARKSEEALAKSSGDSSAESSGESR